MNLKNFIDKLKSLDIVYKLDEPLSKYTTWKAGGNADVFVETVDVSILTKLIAIAIEFSIPYTVLGSGSNVLISDEGIRGLVIKNKTNSIKILDDEFKTSSEERITIKPRLIHVDTDKYYDFSTLDYDESNEKKVLVNIESGTIVPYAINYLINNGITGLQWFAGIPGTIGGATVNNIHGGSHFFSEFVQKVEVLNEKGEIKTLLNSELDFDYDFSRFHDSKEIILNVTLELFRGDTNKSRATVMAWTKLKMIQPRNTAGCTFRNISTAEQERLKLPSNSWGYIIDKVLKLKGVKVNNVKISEKHAAFIETEGETKAKDVLELMDIIYRESKEKLGIVPIPEVFLLGFPADTVKKYFQ